MTVADFEALGAALLVEARDAIAVELGVEAARIAAARSLDESGATFVTLVLDERLRGCVGTLNAHRRLLDDVRINAVAAAFDDPRFTPLTAPELPSIRIEVSLLGAPVEMTVDSESEALARLRPAEDGVVLTWRGRSATFLPQVWASLPDPAVFLRTLKRKAGLPGDFWARDLRLERYSVRKWAERDAPVRETQP